MPESESGWKQMHTILVVIALVVSMTIGGFTFFVRADEFKQFKGEVASYQLEDQALRANDRIIELNRDLEDHTLTPSQKAAKKTEKEKLEKRVEYLEKRIDAQATEAKQTK